MKCDLCDAKPALVHITRTAGPDPLTIHLCEPCAIQMGVNDPTGFSLADLHTAVRAAQRKNKGPTLSALAFASPRLRVSAFPQRGLAKISGSPRFQ